MNNELDFSKPEELQTRDGRAVRIYATDGIGNFPIHGAVFTEEKWAIAVWMKDGSFCSTTFCSQSDLVRKPRRVTGWVNLYDLMGQPAPCFGDAVFRTQEEAKRSKVSRYTCLGQIYIDAEIQT